MSHPRACAVSAARALSALEALHAFLSSAFAPAFVCQGRGPPRLPPPEHPTGPTQLSSLSPTPPATLAPRTTQLWKCFCGARSLPGLCFLSHCAQTTHLSLSSFTLSTPLGKGPYPIHLRILRPPGGRRSWKVSWKKRQTELPVRWLWVLAVVPPS